MVDSTDNIQTIIIQDLDDWRKFAKANYAELIAIAGSINKAEVIAYCGGLVIGGGATPLFYITFAD